MKKNMNRTGVLILIGIFLIFYIITTFLLDKRNLSKDIPAVEEPTVTESVNHDNEIAIVNNLYNQFRMLYDVVNNKFTVSQEDVIVIGGVTYKRITNFDEAMNNIFTENGIKKYIDDLKSYFAYTDGDYYLAGNLVSYQTYYFRGDDTHIYILDSKENEIDGLIYERWTGNNKNTLARIKVVNKDGKWLVDNIEILATE